MKKWNLIVDVALCSGCRNCVMAVKDEYVGNEFPGYSKAMPPRAHDWVQIRTRERGVYPVTDIAYLFHACQHCDDAPCIAAARDGAVRKRDDGLVVFDPVKATGQRQLVDACPFGAITWNEELSVPQHWNFDAHLLDAGWPAPRPVQACPTGALRAIKVEDPQMRQIAEDEGLEPLAPGQALRTRVHYRNLARYTSAFVAGTLVGSENGLEACIGGVEVNLTRGSGVVARATSDAYGDFKFDGLPPGAGAYRVDIVASGYQPRTLELQLTDSKWLGEIVLTRSENP